MRAAAQRYDRPLQEWLDLSTGINPHGYPVPALDTLCWRRLPEDEDELEAAACDCYGAAHALPVPGSQAAIQLLPRLLPAGRVLMLTPSYEEHARAWLGAGHEVHRLPVTVAEHALEDVAQSCAAVLLCQPNNPTGTSFALPRLQVLAQSLARRGGVLVTDEAFVDPAPELSLASMAGRLPYDNIIVLRSLGKFFGLAGARVGFVVAQAQLLARLREAIGPWAVAGPSRAVASAALRDRVWQAAMCERLARDTERLRRLLLESGLGESQGTSLFRWVPHIHAGAIHEALARQAILVRLLPDPPSLRFGLPDAEPQWTRLATALREALAMVYAAQRQRLQGGAG